jgi:recombination protein RecA
MKKAKEAKDSKEVKDKKSTPDMKTAGGKEASDRNKKLEALAMAIKKNHGDGAVFYGHQPIKAVEVIPTGSMILDVSSGIGGMPRGRIIEIYGPEASGKTTLSLSIVAQAHKMGLSCAYVDVEHALDVGYARKLGVDVDKLLLSQPDFAEQALDIIKQIAESGSVDIIVLDSVAALVPKAELEGEMADQSMGVQARMMSKHLRVITGILHKSNCLGVFINQVRMKIGVMYGNPETTTGGNALKFYASVRMRVSKGTAIGSKEAPIGHMLNVKFAKNKMAPPFVECEVPIIYGKGIDAAGDLFTIAREWSVIEGGGAHSYFDGEKIGASRDETVKRLTEDKVLFNKIDAAVRAMLKKKQEEGEVAPQGAPEPEEEGVDPDAVKDEEKTAE